MQRLSWSVGIGAVIAILSLMPVAVAQPKIENRPTRWDCLVGYPDGSFRGDRSLSRFEFAAAMAACLDQQLQQVEAQQGGFATRQDVETLRQTQQELNREIQQLQERVRQLADE